MRSLAQTVSALALLAVVGAALLFFWGRIELAVAQRWLLIATGGWFLATPLWLDRGRRDPGPSPAP